MKAMCMGKGPARLRNPQRKLHPDMSGWAIKQTSLREIAEVECEASNLEEPGAVIPHAGICAGAAG
jgi:hypothetical protein